MNLDAMSQPAEWQKASSAGGIQLSQDQKQHLHSLTCSSSSRTCCIWPHTVVGGAASAQTPSATAAAQSHLLLKLPGLLLCLLEVALLLHPLDLALDLQCQILAVNAQSNQVSVGTAAAMPACSGPVEAGVPAHSPCRRCPTQCALTPTR